MSPLIDQNARPVIFGECLFDHYPDGKRVLAGAPLAVAWHLQGFGLRPILITRVGQDSEGELALATLHQWGLDTRAIQIDACYPTGSAKITSDQGEHRFEIKPDQAWDHITHHLALEWVKTLPCSLLYAGSLAQRSEVSQKTLRRLISDTNLPLFIDINIRAPWNKAVIIKRCLQEAQWLKLNENELSTIQNSHYKTDNDIMSAIKMLRTEYDINTVYLTQAEKGAISINSSERYKHKIDAQINVANSVGAGDAFTAVCILGLHKNWDQQQTLARANDFAARICQPQGATVLTKQDYADYLTKWA